MRPAGTRARPFGFTILELLVVIAVIAILAAISLTAAFLLTKHMDIKTARANAARLSRAIESYSTQRSCLPVHSNYDPVTAADGAYENAEILEQLNVKDREPFFTPRRSELNANGSFKDTWGTPYRYLPWKAKPSDVVYKFHQVYSCGPNMRWEMGGGDDIPAP
jgi:prepilin-type N-terminal cleavage/methylation domain-containing protein